MLAVGAVMYVAGDWASAGKEGQRRFGAALAGAALIAVMAFGILRRIDLLALAFGAAGFGLSVLGTAWIVLSLLSFLFGALASAMTAPIPEPKPSVFVPPETAPKSEPAPPPPPPPTREERLAAAKQRYESSLQMLASAGLDEIEFKAAQEKAKQQYLRDLDGVL